jgi:hypothetical protein
MNVFKDIIFKIYQFKTFFSIKRKNETSNL